MDKNRRKLIEETFLPEDEGILSSKTISMSNDGSIRKDVKVPFCDFCGTTLKEERLALCSSCRRKICPSCMITHENKIHCRECTKHITGLSKEVFFALYGVANEASLKDIKHASSMNSETMEEAIHMMLERGIIEMKGLSIFTRYSVTDKGLAVLATCEQIYRNEGDVSRFLLRLQEFQSEA